MRATSLNLPSRSTKPRSTGLTMCIDSGMPAGAFADAIDSAEEYIDVVKFGWGTALVTSRLAEKTAILDEYGIGYFFGGTLFEKFVVQRRFEDYLSLCHDHGCCAIEISNGTIPLTNAAKTAYIAAAAAEFVVFSEVGFKDEERSNALDAGHWVSYIEEDLDAGSAYVIIEARESGKSGICQSDGVIRADVVEHILGAEIPPDRLMFEAPTKELQTFCITRLGSDVNLGNISVGEVLATETLRLGLRGDTLLHFELQNDGELEAGQLAIRQQQVEALRARA
ncbi:MAG: phosphosulfolactate synthase [Acidimicrobiales bacterium]